MEDEDEVGEVWGGGVDVEENGEEEVVEIELVVEEVDVGGVVVMDGVSDEVSEEEVSGLVVELLEVGGVVDADDDGDDVEEGDEEGLLSEE